MPSWGRMTPRKSWGRDYGNYRTPEEIAAKKAQHERAMNAAFAEIDARAAENRAQRKAKEEGDGQKIDNS